MSAEQAKAFVEKMKSDEAFRAKVMAEKDAEARMALQELGEAELSEVAGGGLEDPVSDAKNSACGNFANHGSARV